MSTLLQLPQSEWRTFFDRMSNALLGKWAEIEVASLDLGDQIVVEWIPLLGITYESSGPSSSRDPRGADSRRSRERRGDR
jgi:hypothetical protein